MVNGADEEAIFGLIDECGFECHASCEASLLQVKPEVRDMCAANRCHSYDANWCCPPACGTIEHYAEMIAKHARCYLAQTVGQMEDSFDFETMVETGKLQDERCRDLWPKVKERFPEARFLASGACTVCEKCTYPDAPCANPGLRMVSMEAAGLVVNEVCEAAGLPYNHGANTVAYTACVLL